MMINERLDTILNHFGLSPSQMALKLGVQRSGISHILSGRNRPGLDFVTKLLQSFPQINAEWLLSGKGEMLKSEVKSKTRETQEILSFPEQKDSDPPIDVKSDHADLRSRSQAIEEKKNASRGVGQVVLENTKATMVKAEKIIILYHDGTYEEFIPKSGK